MTIQLLNKSTTTQHHIISASHEAFNYSTGGREHGSGHHTVVAGRHARWQQT